MFTQINFFFLFSKIEIYQKSQNTFPRYLFLDGFGKFVVIVWQFFLPLLKKRKLEKKNKQNKTNHFWQLLTNKILSRKSDDLNIFLL